jgi:hypothetical protein
MHCLRRLTILCSLLLPSFAHANFWMVEPRIGCVATFEPPPVPVLMRSIATSKGNIHLLSLTEEILSHLPKVVRERFLPGDSLYELDNELYVYRESDKSVTFLNTDLHRHLLPKANRDKDYLTKKQFDKHIGKYFQPVDQGVKEFLTDPSGQWTETKKDVVYVFERGITVVLEDSSTPVQIKIRISIDLAKHEFQTTLRASKFDFSKFMTDLDNFIGERNSTKSMASLLRQNTYNSATAVSEDLMELDRFIEELVYFLYSLER